MIKLMKKSLTRQLIYPLILVSVLALIGAGFLSFIDYQLEERSIEEKIILKEKLTIVDSLEDNIMLMLFHARGYYLLKNPTELESLNLRKERLLELIEEFSTLELNESELSFIEEVNAFLEFFETELFPTAVNFVEKDDYQGLRTFSEAGATNRVLSLIVQTREFSETFETRLEKLSEIIIAKTTLFKYIYVGYIFMILMVLGIFLRRVSKNIGIPLQELTIASQTMIDGKNIVLTQLKREDEIGIFSRAFLEMTRSIQSKEEELTAQNEELLAQQETLEEQQERLEKSLLELKNINIALNESAIVVITDDKGIIKYVNDRFCMISKYSKEELIGFNHRIINSGYHSKEFFTNLWSTIKSGKVWTGEIKNRAKDGSFYWVETTIVPYLDQVGKPYQFIAVRTDITEIKLAEEKIQASYEETEMRRQLNQDIIDHVNEGITFIDTDGVLMQYNNKITEFLKDPQINLINFEFERWVGILKERVVDKENYYTFLRSAIYTTIDGIITHRIELESDEKLVYDIYTVAIYRNNMRLGTLIVYRDITNEYKIDQTKSELVSTVSHELRTPLSSVLGFAELMLTKELKPERQRKYIQTIHKEASRLTNLINDFLDLQKMESGKQSYNKKETNIVSILRDTVQTFDATNKSHQFIINSDEQNILVYGDEEKLIQLFTNLISNAVKFSPEGGNVTLDFSLQNQNVVLSIKDEGLGIPAEETANLFQKFYRIDNSDRRKIGGTGLGLAICKQIVEAHDGTISVSSRLGEGSTFYVILPFLQKTSSQRFDIQQQKLGEPEIIIVEDDESYLFLLLDELKELEVHIAHYNNGKDALTAIKERLPKLVILDIMLGTTINGWDIINILKAEDQTKDIPIIISSALDEKEKGIALGINHYLTKPYPPSRLSVVVLEMLLKEKRTGEILIPIEEIEE